MMSSTYTRPPTHLELQTHEPAFYSMLTDPKFSAIAESFRAPMISDRRRHEVVLTSPLHCSQCVRFLLEFEELDRRQKIDRGPIGALTDGSLKPQSDESLTPTGRFRPDPRLMPQQLPTDASRLRPVAAPNIPELPAPKMPRRRARSANPSTTQQNG